MDAGPRGRLNRPDLPVLPLGGVRWRPAENRKLDIMVPRPRASWRIDVDDDGEMPWFYIGGALGGDSRAFDSAAAPTNRVGYLDLRVVTGLELRKTDRDRHIFELGNVFDGSTSTADRATRTCRARP